MMSAFFDPKLGFLVQKGYNFKWPLPFTGYFKINENSFLYAQKLNCYLYSFYDGKILF